MRYGGFGRRRIAGPGGLYEQEDESPTFRRMWEVTQWTAMSAHLKTKRNVETFVDRDCCRPDAWCFWRLSVGVAIERELDP